MTKAQEFNSSLYTLWSLTSRHLKLFLKDKVSVFFSMLAPLIVLLLYVLFLGNVQVESVQESLPEGIEVSAKAIRAFIDAWMIVGVLGVACVTVSLGANSVMVQDKARGIMNDSFSAPVKKWVITLSYFLFNFLATVAIVMVVFVICLIYIAASGGWYMSVGDVFGTVGILLFGSLSSTLITVFMCKFFRTESQHGAITVSSAPLSDSCSARSCR